MTERATEQARKNLLFQGVTLVAVALASAAAGFVAVVYWFAPAPTAGGGESPAGQPASTAAAPSAEPDQPEGDQPAAQKQPAAPAASPVPWVTMGEPFYWRCWAAGKRRPQTKNCDRLQPLERIVAGKLSLAARCHKRHGVSRDQGTLNLAVEANFARRDDRPGEAASRGPLRLWAGKSSSLRRPADVVSCMRRELGEVSLGGIEHRRQRYVIFFPITFAPPEGSRPPGWAAQLRRDKVRLRRAPETGEVQARLRRGELLRVLDRREEWLRVRTSDGLEGWVFAQAVEDSPRSKP